MKKGLDSHISADKLIHVLTVLMFSTWIVTFLYLLSSSQIRQDLYNYREELHLKEKNIDEALSKTARSNPPTFELTKLYDLLIRNKICQADFLAAEKDIEKALHLVQALMPTDREQMPLAYLRLANLSRDCGKFDTAKTSYEHSLNCLHQITLASDFSERDLGITVVNFNNLGVLSFLKGQASADAKQSQTSYLAARNYLIQAKTLMDIAGYRTSRCLQKNIALNLDQCLTEMQFTQ